MVSARIDVHPVARVARYSGDLSPGPAGWQRAPAFNQFVLTVARSRPLLLGSAGRLSSSAPSASHAVPQCTTLSRDVAAQSWGPPKDRERDARTLDGRDHPRRLLARHIGDAPRGRARHGRASFAIEHRREVRSPRKIDRRDARSADCRGDSDASRCMHPCRRHKGFERASRPKEPIRGHPQRWVERR